MQTSAPSPRAASASRYAGLSDRHRQLTAPGFCPESFIKRAFDISLAAALMMVGAPIILACMLLVKLTSRGPAIYRQTRLGRSRRPFTIYKIRTMTNNSEALTGACWAKVNDPRVTTVGRFLRTSHLDELPQLWNILRGDMSLVGPRPERPEIIGEIEREIDRYGDRMLVRPGVTGLAQVHLPPDTDIESVRRKVVYDRYYVLSAGFWLDFRLLAITGLSLIGIPFWLSCNVLLVPGSEIEFGPDYLGHDQRFLVASAQAVAD